MSKPAGTGRMSLSNLLWIVVAVVVVLWLLGLVGGFGGNLIHALLVLALLVVVYNLIAGRRTVSAFDSAGRGRGAHRPPPVRFGTSRS